MSELANLRRLDAFVAVAEELHFGRAADRLHIAQPALSQQIRQLEADLGLALLERTTRRVGLTPDGAAFLPHARQLLVSAQGVARAAEELRVGARGRLRLGFVDSTAFEFVPWFLRRFRSAWPEADVELHTMSSDEQARALVDGDIDLGVARTVPVRPAVDSAVLGHDRFDLLGPVGPPCLELQAFGAKQSRGKIRDTEAKMACGLEGSNSSCVVVSVGSNGQWTFEEDVFARTGCRVEVFDCTVDPKEVTVPMHLRGRVRLHHHCIGPSPKDKDKGA